MGGNGSESIITTIRISVVTAGKQVAIRDVIKQSVVLLVEMEEHVNPLEFVHVVMVIQETDVMELQNARSMLPAIQETVRDQVELGHVSALLDFLEVLV